MAVIRPITEWEQGPVLLQGSGLINNEGVVTYTGTGSLLNAEPLLSSTAVRKLATGVGDVVIGNILTSGTGAYIREASGSLAQNASSVAGTGDIQSGETFIVGPLNVNPFAVPSIFDNDTGIINVNATWVVVSETPLDGTFGYFPGGGFRYTAGVQLGVASFVYRILDADGLGTNFEATVTVGVTDPANAPVFSDDFESYALGPARTSGALSGGWDDVRAKDQARGDVAVLISDDFSRSGSRCLKVDIGNSGESMTGLRYALPVDLRTSFYVQWWEYHSSGYDDSGSKWNRFRSDSIGLDYPGGIGLIFANSPDAQAANADNGLSESSARCNFPESSQDNIGVWERWEVHFNLGDVDVANGQCVVYKDLSQISTSPILKMRATNDVIDYIELGGWVGGSRANFIRYIDDVKISGSYIGDAYDGS